MGGEPVEGELVGGGEVVGGEELAEGEGLAGTKELVNGGAGCAGEVEVVRTEQFVIATYPSVFLPFPSFSLPKKEGDTYEQHSTKPKVSNSCNAH